MRAAARRSRGCGLRGAAAAGGRPLDFDCSPPAVEADGPPAPAELLPHDDPPPWGRGEDNEPYAAWFARYVVRPPLVTCPTTWPRRFFTVPR